MFETDAILLSLCIFVPTLFALAVLFFPKGSEEYMRWWTLLGTAVTLVLTIILFIDYLGLLSTNFSVPENTTLTHRAMATMVSHNSTRVGADRRPSDDVTARYQWIGQFNIEYFLGIDGISMALVLLTTVLFFLSMIASWGITKYVKGYCALFLLLETGVIGTFLALDFFLFYIFWEVMLLPMYFLIGIWGGPRREYAAIKFFLYTLFGSILILIAMLAFYFTDVRDFVPDNARNEKNRTAPENKFDLIVLAKAGKAAKRVIGGEDPRAVADSVLRDTFTTGLTPQERDILTGADEKNADKKARLQARMDSFVRNNVDDAAVRMTAGSHPYNQAFFSETFQNIMFVLLFVGFAIKVPVFPFHTWLPDAHVEAPTPISMILAGILLKLGGYGILRIAYPICPWAAYFLANYIALLGIINIVYGAFAAMAQTDFKKLVAYSSISHMGYVILGIAVWSSTGSTYWSWGMNGAMYQMIGHGISSAGMFFLVGVIYDRAHHRNLDNFRGLLEPMPLYGGISAIIFFAALGLPGLCGFVGEFMVVLATWNYSKVYAVLAALTVVITAAYILWTMQRVYFGTNPAYKDYPDMSMREILCATPLVVLAVLLGILPQLVLSWMEPDLTGLVDSLLALR